MKSFALLAGVGLILSAAAHLSTLFGVDADKSLPSVWLLHIGMFVVMIPAIVGLRQNRANREFRWRDAMGHAPSWMRWLTVLLVAHAFINSLAFHLVCGSGGPERESNGTYSISGHGRIIRQITAAEYQRARAYEFRSFSCWWMLYYCVALTLLISEISRRKTLGSTTGDEDKYH